MERVRQTNKTFAPHGWLGLFLIAVFWALNWGLPGTRTHWGFFPLWLGYCLLIDALVYWRKGTSLLSRSWRKYVGLFLVSAPVWWLFEALNWRVRNWVYAGAAGFSPFQYWFWATLSFTTVVPAVFGTAELVASFGFLSRMGQGPVIKASRRTTLGFFVAGLGMLAVMLAWPSLFFPFLWISMFFTFEPVNVWLGNRSLTEWTSKGDWRPIMALWIGVLITAFFWEMWNYFSYPKWVYQVAWGDWLHLFEMPLLGYGGYLPFSLELFAIYHLIAGAFGERKTSYVQIAPK